MPTGCKIADQGFSAAEDGKAEDGLQEAVIQENGKLEDGIR